MNQLPDDLFRRRLKEHSLTPPPSAWSRIETNLSANRRTIWIKVAAAVMLLLAASAYIVTLRDNHGQRTIADEPSIRENSVRQSDRDARKPATNDGNAMETVEPLASEEMPQTRPPAPSDIRDTFNSTQLPSTRSDLDVADIMPSHPKDTEPVERAADTHTTPYVAASLPASEPAPMKLVLEVDEVQEKYLRKKSVAHATEGDARSSGLKKLLDKANGISNQDPIGDLRQMKNDIFALNFQGRKRDQHK